jgi:hypothetical protein
MADNQISVWISSVDQSSGVRLSVHLSEEAMWHDLYDMASDDWDEEELGPMPDDHQEGAEAYLGYVGDMLTWEEQTITVSVP